ncbi:threonylcarbamoyl-AMP synthase [Dermabacteraceae bacterium TAE3-ERU5]|nr:threonylcarbamoyl-AMP synthase [Dermabacteraceae bacterium TAE3-ERU5]
MSVYDCRDEKGRAEGIAAATAAIRDGKLIVLPTDTVYGVGADAFNADAVQDLLHAKGRDRQLPPPVLVGDTAVLHALGSEVPQCVEALVEKFWPGPLTVIVRSQPSLRWDLGETRGTVALRMPDHEVAIELLRETGPLAVSSANRHGRDAATTVVAAATQLGDEVEVYLDGGETVIREASTIIDATVEPPEIVRQGALSKEEIVAALGDIFAAPQEDEEETSPEAAENAAADGTAEATEDADTADAAEAGNSVEAAEVAEAESVAAPAAEATAAAAASHDALSEAEESARRAFAALEGNSARDEADR